MEEFTDVEVPSSSDFKSAAERVVNKFVRIDIPDINDKSKLRYDDSTKYYIISLEPAHPFLTPL